ncbi:MAG: FHA domain-containing protein [Pirellulaceae bacterium]|nr:FHA domain-containing protein [Pirellulaceae bacterium]
MTVKSCLAMGFFHGTRERNTMFGELNPTGGGDEIPLLKKRLLIGRRENCDITLRFPNVSSKHCELYLESGYWYVKDLGSRNGIKVNDRRVTKKRLDPGSRLSVAKHTYVVEYDPVEMGAVGPPPAEEDTGTDIMKSSLLERAGLQRRHIEEEVSADSKPDQKKPNRYNPSDDSSDQIKVPHRPI